MLNHHTVNITVKGFFQTSAGFISAWIKNICILYGKNFQKMKMNGETDLM